MVLPAEEIRSPVPPPTAWSAKPWPDPGKCGLWSRNWNTAEGYPKRDRGFSILRNVQGTSPSAFNKGGASFTHAHLDGTYYSLYWFNGAWYRDTGSAAASLVTGLGDLFAPAFAQLQTPAAISLGLLGDNAKAYGFRKEGSALAAFLWDLPAPTGDYSVSTPTTGGSLSDGTYYVKITQIDDTGAQTVESIGMATKTVVLSGGTGTQSIDLDLTGSGGVVFDARATKYRVYLSTSSDAADSFFQSGADTLKATTSFEINDTSVGTAIPSRNSVYQQAHLPVSAVDVVAVGSGRFFYGSSTTSPYVWWSEVGNPNHIFATNVSSVAEGGTIGRVTALGYNEDALYVFTPTSVHMGVGDFGRESDGTVRAKFRQIESGVGCVSPQSVVAVPEIGLFFMSQFGPCVIVGSRVLRLGHDDFADFLDFLDFDYAKRWVGGYSQRLRQFWCLVTRKTNANRIEDGAANAGIGDCVVRWNLDEMSYSPWFHAELTHLNLRPVPASEGGTSLRALLTGVGPHGGVKRLDYTRSHGPTGDVSGTDYNSQAATTYGTTSAVLGISAFATHAALEYGIAIHFPSDDVDNPNAVLYRTVKTSVESGGSVTLAWEGATPASNPGASGDKPSIRVGGCIRALELAGLVFHEDASVYAKVNHVSVQEVDIVGREARS